MMFKVERTENKMKRRKMIKKHKNWSFVAKMVLSVGKTVF